MIKLCVGADTIDDLVSWQTSVIARREAEGLSANAVHETRMTPKRAAELEDGGSMYWVIKHKIRARQRILRIEKVEANGEVPSFCIIHLDPEIILTQLRVKRPFQGWRYLKPGDAPPDINPGAQSLGETPAHLEMALKDAGVW